MELGHDTEERIVRYIKSFDAVAKPIATRTLSNRSFLIPTQ